MCGVWSSVVLFVWGRRRVYVLYKTFTGSSLANSKNRRWLGSEKTVIKMCKFGQIEIESKKFNSVYQVQKDVDLEKIRVSEGVVVNGADTRFTVAYEVEPGRIVPLYIKTPRDCLSSGVSRYNEASPWKMGFNVGENEAWICQYEGIRSKVKELLSCKLEGEPLSNERYVNPKLIAWGLEIRTKFKGNYLGFIEEIGACYATGILKIASVYRQGSNHHLQIFWRNVSIPKREMSVLRVNSVTTDERR